MTKINRTKTNKVFYSKNATDIPADAVTSAFKNNAASTNYFTIYNNCDEKNNTIIYSGLTNVQPFTRSNYAGGLRANFSTKKSKAAKMLLITTLLLIFFTITTNYETFASNYIHPIFPNGDTDVSVAARILFQSEYPVNTEALRSTSPISLDDDGNRLSAHFLVVPTEYLSDPLRAYYSVDCKLYISDDNLLTILPYKPFSYNTSYSVVFDNFPMMIPDISNPNGYTEHNESFVFADYFTTTPVPLNFSFSFEESNNLIWCANNISVKFNRAINPSSNVLSEMFSIVEAESGDEIPVDVSLSDDGMVADLFPSLDLAGGVYFLRTNLSGYTGDERLDDSYRFAVNDEIVITFKSEVDSNYRNSQYGYYSTFKYGDTAYFNTYRFTDNEDYVFSDWDLPGKEGTNYTVDSNGMLKVIFDCNNYFSGNNLPTTDITLSANYIENPIEDILVRFDLSDVPSECRDYYKGYEFSNSLSKKIDEDPFNPEWKSIRFYYHKYSDKPMSLYNTYEDGYIVGETNCSIGIGSVAITTPEGEEIDLDGGDVDVERPVAPFADGGLIAGGWTNITITLEKKEPCKEYTYVLNINFVSENENTFDFLPAGLIDDASKMFSTVTFDGAIVDLTDINLFTDNSNYSNFKAVKTIVSREPSIPYSIVLAPEYSDFYEIYNYFDSDLKHSESCFSWGAIADWDGNNLAGSLRAVDCPKARQLYVQIRRKIVDLEIKVHKYKRSVELATSVPTYNQAHLSFMNGDEQKVLKIENYKLLNHMTNKNIINAHRAKPKVVETDKFARSLKVVNEESTTYSFYAGETINCDPFIRDHTGYNFVEWAELPDGASYIDAEERAFELHFDGKEKVKMGDMLLGEGFRLEYIGTLKRLPEYDNYDWWTFPDASNVADFEERPIRPWKNNKIYADSGVGMTAGQGRQPTTALIFEFNKPLEPNSFMKNVSVRDLQVYEKNDNLRYDSNILINADNTINNRYEYDRYNSNLEGYQNNRFYFELDNPYPICHMMPFEIEIKNSVDGGIRTYDPNTGEILGQVENVDKVFGETLTAITMTPSIVIRQSEYRNHWLWCYDYWWSEEPFPIDAVITGFIFVDVVNAEPVTSGLDTNKLGDIVQSIVASGDLGRLKLGAFMHRNPTVKWKSDLYPGGYIGPESSGDRLYGSTRLYHNQRLNYVAMWFDHDTQFRSFDCDELESDGTKVSDAISDYFTAGTISVSNFANDILKGLLCHDNNEDTDYHWLANNKFSLTRIIYDGNFNSPCDVNGKPYDWNLWGAGKYGMYKEVSKRAFGSGFNHILDTETGEYKIKNISDSSTEIKIQIVN